MKWQSRPLLTLWFAIFLLLCGHRAGALEMVEEFNAPPARWKLHGDPGLFHWNAKQQQLEVTWDSRRTNSFFYLPLPAILTKADDFSLNVRLRMESISIGVSSNRPFTFQLALGWINLIQATNTNFFRGSGVHPVYGGRNLVEFNYFPDSGFGATFAPTVISSNNQLVFSDNHPLEWTLGNWFEIEMEYRTSNQVLRTRILRDGQPFGMPPGQTIEDLSLAGFPDFRLGAFSIHSYSDENQPPPGGSLLARGTVDRIQLRIPDPPTRDLTARLGPGGRATFQFQSQTNWIYQWESSRDLRIWSRVGEPRTGDGSLFILPDQEILSGTIFYRVQSWRP